MGKFCDTRPGARNQRLASLISLSQNEPRKYGYARVSLMANPPALQIAALQRDRCKKIFKDEGLSGVTTKRPALEQLL
jgi:hypothetical protein